MRTIIGARITRRQYIKQLIKLGQSSEEIKRRLALLRKLRVPFAPENPIARKAYLEALRKAKLRKRQQGN